MVNLSIEYSDKKVTPLGGMSLMKRFVDSIGKIRIIDSKNGQKTIAILQDICDVNKYIDMESYSQIEVKKMPAVKVAYVSYVGSFDGIGKAYKRLMKWAGQNELIGGKKITCYHDNPEVTDIDKIRQNACIELSKKVRTSGDIKTTTIESGEYAVGKFEVCFNEFEKAW